MRGRRKVRPPARRRSTEFVGPVRRIARRGDDEAVRCRRRPGRHGPKSTIVRRRAEAGDAARDVERARLCRSSSVSGPARSIAMSTADASQPFADGTLETARTSLRWHADDDLDALLAWPADLVVRRFGSEPAVDRPRPGAAEDRTGIVVRRSTGRQPAGESSRATTVRASGRAACTRSHRATGAATSVPGWRADRALAREAGRRERGRGRARRARFHHPFITLDLHRIEADIDPDDAASIRVVERLGFVLEGRLREERRFVDGEWRDASLHGRLAPRARLGGDGSPRADARRYDRSIPGDPAGDRGPTSASPDQTGAKRSGTRPPASYSGAWPPACARTPTARWLRSDRRRTICARIA